MHKAVASKPIVPSKTIENLEPKRSLLKLGAIKLMSSSSKGG
ncbi:unnamed protein product [marine sediment metagenome]|uniref:Uncharacterized protein n=1 Tax=marine sediment metagenome TaxID=412755 RepID=X1CKX7_9ZZZZ